MASFVRPADPDDKEVREDRERRALPWSINPFTIKKHGQPSESSGDLPLLRPSLESQLTRPPVFAWTDLMLDLAMAAAFANLTGNTKIISGYNVISYLSFFSLVFWIWASMVAYNVRYRQDDWIHRLYAFLQLCVFGALCAFTNSFDITVNLYDDGSEERLGQAQAASGYYSQSDIAIEKFSRDRLPPLNAKGISLVMAASRLLLLIPYIMVFYHAGRSRNKTLLVPIIALTISTALYFAAYGVMVSMENPDIAKLVLWYLPIVLEIASLYLESYMPDNIGYDCGEVLWEKYSTMTAVIVGEGLNGITATFRFLVGSPGFAANTIGSIFSTGLLIFMLWMVYYETGRDLVRGSHRALTWGFLHYFYFSAIIVMLEAIEKILSTVNLINAVEELSNLFATYINTDPTNQAGIVGTLNDTLVQVGWTFDIVNATLYSFDTEQEIDTAFWQTFLKILWDVLKRFEARPDEASDLTVRLYSLLENSTLDGLTVQNWIVDTVAPNLQSGRWFLGTAGGSLMFLALLNYVQRPPTDKYAWGSILSRFLTGFIVALLSLLNIGQFALVDADTVAPLWVIYTKGWILPLFAMMLVLLAVVDYVLLYLAVRTYRPVPKHWEQEEGVVPSYRPNEKSWGNEKQRRESSPQPQHPILQDWDGQEQGESSMRRH